MKLATGSAETPRHESQACKGCANPLKIPLFAVQFTRAALRYFALATGRVAGLSLSLIMNTRNFAGWVALAFFD